MGLVKRFFPSQRKEGDPLEGSFNYALEVYGTLPTTCPHLVDYSCGRGRVILPDSLSLLFGTNAKAPEVEVFVAAHQSNDEFEREALILVQHGSKRAIFRVKRTSDIKEVVQEIDGEEQNGKVVANQRRVFLELPSGVTRELKPDSNDFLAFKELLALANTVRIEPLDLWCNGCAAKEDSLPRPVVREE